MNGYSFCFSHSVGKIRWGVFDYSAEPIWTIRTWEKRAPAAREARYMSDNGHDVALVRIEIKRKFPGKE